MAPTSRSMPSRFGTHRTTAGRRDDSRFSQELLSVRLAATIIFPAFGILFQRAKHVRGFRVFSLNYRRHIRQTFEKLPWPESHPKILYRQHIRSCAKAIARVLLVVTF